MTTNLEPKLLSAGLRDLCHITRKTAGILLFPVLLFLSPFSGWAALNGTYTINPSGSATTTNYQSITAAVSDMMSGTRGDGGPANGTGVSGPVVLELASGYSSSGETFPLVFGAITGASPINMVTIRPEAAAAAVLTITSSATVTVDLSGCNYVVFDGRPGGTGTSQYLIISNSSTSGIAIRMVNDASSNIFRYCSLRGVNTSTSSGVVVFSTSTGTTGNDSNTIDNCEIRDGASTPNNCVYASGTSGKENNANTISNCTLLNYFNASTSSAGIFISSNNTGWTVSGNSFYQTASRTATAGNTHYGIEISASSGTGFTVSGNYIGGGAVSCGGTAWTIGGSFANRFVGILMNVSTSAVSNIQGNVVKNFSWSTSSGATTVPGVWSGIYVSGGYVNVGTTSGNTIGASSGTGSVNITSSTSGAMTFVLALTGGTTTASGNSIGAITVNGSSTSVSHGIVGIYCAASTFTISSNAIGSSTAGSIQAATASTSTTGQPVCGIWVNSGSSGTISGNTITNLTNAYTASSSSTFSGCIKGIVIASSGLSGTISALSGTYTVSGNTISNLSSASAFTGTMLIPAITGIHVYVSTSSAATTVSQNTVHSISSTTASAAVNMMGIYYRHTSASNTSDNVIARNLVHSLSAASSGVVVMSGIFVYSGTSLTVRNNMVRLGVDAAGSSVTGGYDIEGITENSATSNYYHNSVYIGGGGVTGSTASYAFNSGTTTNTRNFLNNAFVNNRSNGSGTGSHYAVQVGGTGANPAGLAMNYNIYYANGTGGKLGRYNSTNYTTLQTWRAATGMDYYSGYGDPAFVNATGSATAVDLHVSGTTPVESAGLVVDQQTDDYDGSTRASFTPCDIGADAGNFTASDIFSPNVSYATLSVRTASTSNRTLNSVTITDVGVGVPSTGSYLPRIWFRRSAPSTSSWVSTAGTFVSGTATNGVWSFTIDYSLLSLTLSTGDTIQYYLAVQDSAATPNLIFSPYAGAAHTDVNTQTSAPTSPNYYIISAALSTSINVGSGQTYTSLTGSSGFFAAMNTKALNGNTTVYITSNLSEDGTTALKLDGFDGYTLTIQPDAATIRNINNTADLSAAMIRFDGIKGLIVDGRYNGSGRYLLFSNWHGTVASAKPAIQVYNSSTNVTIRNCIIEANSTSTTIGNLQIDAGTNTGIIIQENEIRDKSTFGYPANLIYSGSTTNVMTITDNVLHNGAFAVNLTNAGNGCVVNNNSIYFDGSSYPSTTNLGGIKIASGCSHTVSGNYVGGQSVNCGGSAWTNGYSVTFNAIYVVSTYGSGTTYIQNNTVQNFQFTHSGGATFYGLNIGSAHTDMGMVVTGNLVGHPTADSTIIATASTGTGSLYGILSSCSDTATISGNTIAHMVQCGNAGASMLLGIKQIGTGHVRISNNSVYGFTSKAQNSNSNSPALCGILLDGSSDNYWVEANVVHDLTSNSAGSAMCQGIKVSYVLMEGGTITRNRVYNLYNSSTGTASILGIGVSYGTSWVVSNNQVAITNGSNTNPASITGIEENYISTASNRNYYYNTVYIGGTAASGSQSSTCFYRGLSGTASLRNNLFYNERTGGTGYQVAIYNGYTTPSQSWTSATSNYNLFGGATNLVAIWGATSPISMSQWRDSSGGDFSSLVAITATLPSSQLFTDVSVGDLSIKTGSNDTACWYLNGRGVQLSGYTADYGSTAAGRPVSVAEGAPDIGSDEFTPTSSPPLLTLSGSHTNGGTDTLSFGGLTVATLAWGASGTLPVLGACRYWSGTWPNDPTNAGGAPAAKFMNAYWAISSSGGGGYTYDITLYYDDALLGTIAAENNTVMAKKATGSNGSWGAYTTTLSTTANTMKVTGLGKFSEFTGTDNLNPLPVQLLNLEATVTGSDVLVQWTTASETNSRMFEVERSADGLHFDRAGEKAAAGNTSTLHNYTFTDVNPFGYHRRLYYRLGEKDLNGAVHYSQVISVEKSEGETMALVSQLRPNPFANELHLSVHSDEGTELQLLLYNLSGHVKMSKTIQATSSVQQLTVSDTAGLAPGVYILQVCNGTRCEYHKLVKITF